MNSTIRVSRLAAFALCGVALAACDSVKDVREGPTYPIPSEKVALSGTITGQGVSTTRPVEVTVKVTKDRPYNRTDDPDANGIWQFTRSVRGASSIDFGSLDVGATYEISVTESPFGRNCVPVKPAPGAVVTVTAETDSLGNLKPITDIEIRCDRDDTTPYHVTASFPALVGNLPTGFTLTLTTEEGEQVVPVPANATSVTFDQLPLLYPDENPPTFAYRVTATNTVNGTVNSCAVTNGTGELSAPPPPGGDGNITNVTVTGCLFTIAATASYSAPPDGTAAAIGSGGKVALRDKSGNIVGTEMDIVAGAIPLAANVPSNIDGLYEVLVTAQPAGQFCAADNGGLASLVSQAYIDDPSTPGRDPKLTLINPASVTVGVRCRNLPDSDHQLAGTYQVVGNGDLLPVNAETNPRPLAKAVSRKFLTFFDNGTFLYGVHHSTPASPANSAPRVGVEHGFYNYTPGVGGAPGSLAFNIFTDTNGSVGSSEGVAVSATAAGCGYTFSVVFPGSVGPPCASGTVTGPPAVFSACGGFCTVTAPAWTEAAVAVPSNPLGGLSGVGGNNITVRLAFNSAPFPPVFAGTTTPLTASVTKAAATPGVAPLAGAENPTPEDPGLPAIGRQIGLSFFGTTALTLVEPIKPTWGWTAGDDEGDFWPAGEMEGPWVSADSKRVWIYNKKTLNGWHAGVNGAPNLQESCFPIERRPIDFGAQGSYQQYYARTTVFGFGSSCIVNGEILNVGGTPTASNILSVDAPGILSTPAIVPGFAGRMPGSQPSSVAYPSPIYYKVTPGVGGGPDTLTVQDTANDLPVGDPVVFSRSIGN